MTVHRINSVVVETDDEDNFFEPLNEAFDLHLSAEGRAFVGDMKARTEAGEVRYDDLTNMPAEERARSIAEGCAGDEYHLCADDLDDDEYEELLRLMLHQREAVAYFADSADEAEAGETIDVTDMTREERRALRSR